MAGDCQKRSKGRPREFDRTEALEAALKVFWQKGYEPASVAELCEAMKLKPPSMYCTFGNKAALFLEAIRHYEETYWSEPAQRFLAEPDIYKAVADFFNAATRILLAPNLPCGCMVVLAAVNIAPKETEIIAVINGLRHETEEMFATRLARAISDGQIPTDTDVPALAKALNTFLEGLSLQARDGLFLSQLLALARFSLNLLPPRVPG